MYGIVETQTNIFYSMQKYENICIRFTTSFNCINLEFIFYCDEQTEELKNIYDSKE